MSSIYAARVVLACSVFSWLLCDRVEGGSVSLAWNASPGLSVAGYTLHYGLASLNYTATQDAGTNLSATVDGLNEGATYFFAVSAYDTNGLQGADCQEISVTVPFPPLITLQPSPQTAQAGAMVFMGVDVLGAPPLAFQWFNGAEAINDATNSLLVLPDISGADAGNYTVVVNNSYGSVTSAVATVTVVGIRLAADTASGASIKASGTSQSPPRGKLTVAKAETSAAPSFASAAGTYNGLFYELDDAGMPVMSVQTAGLLAHCALDPLGNYAGAVYVAGLSNSISGSFDGAGNSSAIVGRAAAGLSDLGVALHLEKNGGTMEVTGAVSNLDPANPWTAALTAELETNAVARMPDFVLGIPAMSGFRSGSVMGVASDGAAFLFGMLGDGTIFWQTAPVCIDGAMPLFVPLYGRSGLLAGWVDLSGGFSTSVLSWIRPSGGAGAGFTNVFEATITPPSATDP